MDIRFTAFVLLTIAACSTTDPQSAASIDYRLPQTNAALDVTLTLTQCDPAVGDFSTQIGAKSTLKIVATPGAQSNLYRINGTDLASARINRTLKITLNNRGVLTAINSKNDDRTAAILGNVLKTAATVASFAADPPEMSVELDCNSQIVDALARVAALEEEIKAKRTALRLLKLTDADIRRVYDHGTSIERAQSFNKQSEYSQSQQEIIEAIDAAAAEVARIRLHELTINFKKALNMNSPSPASQDFQLNLQLLRDKWFHPKYSTDGNDQLSDSEFSARVKNFFHVSWSSETIQQAIQFQSPTKSKTVKKCRFSIATPSTVVAKVEGSISGEAIDGPKTSSARFPVAQWA